MPRIRLQPIGAELELPRGAPLVDALFARGVEFPCGGHGRCRGCRVRVREGEAAIDEADRRAFDEEQLAAGWRLACRMRATDDCSLELAQMEAAILGDDAGFRFEPRDGFGIAVDVGTTTLVAQLLDRRDGAVRAVRSGLNPQTRHGADLMTRLDHATAGGGEELCRLLRAGIGELIAGLLADAPEARDAVAVVDLVGNTAMHHLFGGLDCHSLASHPFTPADAGPLIATGEELGWDGVHRARVTMLPLLGGFVGSDLLAGILATGMHQSAELQVLVDLGTNGEVVVGNRERMLATSTAAGPAFEGARISCGMRAATGAIARVEAVDGALRCSVIGGGTARGLCGSGLVDAVACGLELGLIGSNGRLAEGRESLPLRDGVALAQQDVRELQLAKGAIAAGIGLLVEHWGASLDQVARVHLAGAFGNYIERASARRIGLLPFAEERVAPVGNAALRGAKMALFLDEPTCPEILTRVEQRSLKQDPAFEDRYIDEMFYPAATPA